MSTFTTNTNTGRAAALTLVALTLSACEDRVSNAWRELACMEGTRGVMVYVDEAESGYGSRLARLLGYDHSSDPRFVLEYPRRAADLSTPLAYMDQPRFDFGMNWVLTDSRIKRLGLLPEKQPQTLGEADEFFDTFVRVKSDIKQAILDDCLASKDQSPIQRQCKEVAHTMESFSLACTQFTEHLTHFDANRRDDAPPYSQGESELGYLTQNLSGRTFHAVGAAEPILFRLLDGVRFPFYDGQTPSEWSAFLWALLRRVYPVVQVAAALAPAECGPIKVECPLLDKPAASAD